VYVSDPGEKYWDSVNEQLKELKEEEVEDRNG